MNTRSEVGTVRGGARRSGWRFPHRSLREIVVLALWWVVIAAGLTVAAVYIAGQQ